MTSPQLQGKHIALRALEPTDLDILLKWENDTSLWAVSNTLLPYSRQQMWQYLQNQDGDFYSSRQIRLMATLIESGEPVGTIDLFDFNPQHSRAELGLMLDPIHREKGYAGEMLDLMKRYAANWLHINQLYIYVLDEMHKAKEMFLRNGFSECGKLQQWARIAGNYHDVIIMQCLLNNPNSCEYSQG